MFGVISPLLFNSYIWLPVSQRLCLKEQLHIEKKTLVHFCPFFLWKKTPLFVLNFFPIKITSFFQICCQSCFFFLHTFLLLFEASSFSLRHDLAVFMWPHRGVCSGAALLCNFLCFCASPPAFFFHVLDAQLIGVAYWIAAWITFKVRQEWMVMWCTLFHSDPQHWPRKHVASTLCSHRSRITRL